MRESHTSFHLSHWGSPAPRARQLTAPRLGARHAILMSLIIFHYPLQDLGSEVQTRSLVRVQRTAILAPRRQRGPVLWLVGIGGQPWQSSRHTPHILRVWQREFSMEAPKVW